MRFFFPLLLSVFLALTGLSCHSTEDKVPPPTVDSSNFSSGFPANAVAKEQKLSTNDRQYFSKRIEYWLAGKMVGTKTFRKDGEIVEEHFKDGKRHGPLRCWYKNGKLMFESPFKDGESHGMIQRWYRNGTKWIEVSRKNGKLHGPMKEWNKAGNMKDGYPKFYIEGAEVEEVDYLETMEAAATLPK